MLYGVDAHLNYQAGMNVALLPSQGYSFLIVKATQGLTSYSAGKGFESWLSDARAGGMVPGAYHWLTSSDGTGQCDRFLDRVGDTDGMLLAVDVEDTASPPTWESLTKFYTRFRERLPHHPLLVYSGYWWWQTRNWDLSGFDGVHLWDSRYVSGSGNLSTQYAKVSAAFWTPRYGGLGETTVLQFSSAVSAGGVTVDADAFAGSLGELKGLASDNGGSNMAEFTDADTFGAMPDGVVYSREAEIRNLAAEVAWGGSGFSGDKSAGVVGRLTTLDAKVTALQGAVGDLAAAVAGLSTPTVTVALSAEQIAAITTGAASAVSAAAADAVAQVAAVKTAIGAAGDAIGVLND